MEREKFKDVQALIARYNAIRKKSLKEIKQIIDFRYPEVGNKLKTNKGIVGQILEGYIGNPPNSSASSDIAEIGVELKVLPLKKIGLGLQPKERSKIKSIDYNELALVKWKESKIRKKMDIILFLVYEQPVGLSYKDWTDEQFIFKGPLLYELKEQNENQISNDYNLLHEKTKHGKAHLISESDTQILGAATSGTGKLVKYLQGKEAKQRSYVLKQPFLKQFYKEKFSREKFVSINIPNNETPQQFVRRILEAKLANKTFSEISINYGIDLNSNAKSFSRMVINKVLSIDDKVSIRELETSGVTLKTVPVNKKLAPYESMSFPKFSLVDIIDEYWDGLVDMDEQLEGTNIPVFREQIERPFIFLPIHKEKHNGEWQPVEDWIVGKPIVWEPSQDDLEIIKKQWEKVKKLAFEGVNVWAVKYGSKTRQENNLLKASEDRIIHVRPHAKNSSDIDRPYNKLKGISITWQSFWLNAKFVEGVLKRGRG
jgi:DNA mismatch repair protein MutH